MDLSYARQVLGAEYSGMNKELWCMSVDLGFSTLWNKYIHFLMFGISLDDNVYWLLKIMLIQSVDSTHSLRTCWGLGDSFTCDYAVWFNKNSTLYLLSLSEHPVGREGRHSLFVNEKTRLTEVQWVVSTIMNC